MNYWTFYKDKKEFAKEGHAEWFDMLIGQTDCATEEVEQFKEKMGRYLYVVRK